MSEEPTQNISGGRSFEERIFARFDAIDARLENFDGRLQSFDARLQSFDGRLQALEEQAERRAMETKPIWERALAEILEVKEGLRDLNRKFNVLSRDFMQMRADQEHLEERLDRLES